MTAPEQKTGARIADDVLGLVGNTPMVRLNRLPLADSAEVVAKLEGFSPGGSVKDRIAVNMVRMGEQLGLIDADTTIIEPSSGNTGIGLAMVCAARGYKCIIVMPDSMSLERVQLLRRFGAEVVLTKAKDDMRGAVARATELAAKQKRAFMPSQFDSGYNPDVHRRTTALEILAACGDHIHAFVAGVGTGGTITGVGEVLRSRIPTLRVIAVEPERSAVLSGQPAGNHKIQGIGAGFVPKVLNRDMVDEIRTVSDRDAFDTMNRLAAEEGILAGISSGAAVFVACRVATEAGADKRVVVVLPDTGERYLTVQQYFEV